MKKEIIRKDLISERGLNRLLVGVSKRRGYKNIEFPLTITPPTKIEKHIITISDFWGARNFMLLDFLGHTIINLIYKNIKNNDEELENYIPVTPKNQYTNQIKIDIKNQKFELDLSSLIKKQEFNIEENMLKTFYGFNKIPPKDITNLFHTSSNCRFTLLYPVRVYNYQLKKFTEIYYKIENENIFEYELISSTLTPSNKVYNKVYKVTFSSLLGRLYLYNLLCINFDWVPSKVDFYNLSETSQLLYRKYVLSRNGIENIKFRDTTVISGLGFLNKNYSENIRSVNNALVILKDSSLIKDWGFINNVYNIQKK